MMNKIEGIVIRNEEYKEADSLVTLLTPDQIVTVRARGIGKSTSKNRVICQPFSLVEWMIDQKGQLPLLINGRLYHFYHSIQNDLSNQAVCMICRDAAVRYGTSKTVYTCMKNALTAFEKKEDAAYTWVLLLIRDILVREGIQPYTDGCAICRRKDQLTSLSLKQGGLLCTEHALSSDMKMTKEELIGIYSLFHVSDSDFERFVHMYPFTVQDIVYWTKWLEHYSHLSLQSVRFLETISRMDQQS